MGSTSSPYSRYYKDCSTGICSIYCPQWCYIVFPPPPPLNSDDEDSGTNFSSLVIAIIGMLASAFLLIAYYTLISKYCRRIRSGGRDNQNPVPESESTNLSHTEQDQQWQDPATSGLDQSLIESIAVCPYRKGDGLVECTECAVCLSEFEENEKVRLLPKCSHAFHLPCIDMWLKSHSNCPLCRANVVSGVYALPQSDRIMQNSSDFNISSDRVEPRRDLIVVVEDPGRGHRTEVVTGNGEDALEKFTRTTSLGYFLRRNLFVSDILQISEENEEIELGSSRGICAENGMEVERSMHDTGMNSTSPN